MTTERAGILLKYGVLQCSKKEHRFLFLLNYFTPGIPKEPKHARAWPLSAITAHDSELGQRCAAILAVTALMKPLPPKAA